MIPSSGTHQTRGARPEVMGRHNAPLERSGGQTVGKAERTTEPTIADLQRQLASVRSRLRAVEAIAFRPIQISLTFPGWPHPVRWFREWRAGSENRRIARAKRRHHARALRAWRRLCRRAKRWPSRVSWQQLDRAWAAVNGMDGWKPPIPWWRRLRAWWAARQLRADIRRMWRLMRAAKPEDVERARLRSLRDHDRRIAGYQRDPYCPGYDGRAGLEMGRKAIVLAQRMELKE